MSLLFARLGLVESRASSLLALRRGSQKHVRGEWQQQTRFASWWKFSDGGGSENAFGMKKESKEEEDRRSDLTQEQRQISAEKKRQKLEEQYQKELAEEKRQELECQRSTIEAIRNRGWFSDELAEDAEAEEAENLQDPSSRKSEFAELSWSLMSEDKYWEETSRSAEAEQDVSSINDTREPARGLTGNDMFDTSASTEMPSTDDARNPAWGLTGNDPIGTSTSAEAEQPIPDRNSPGADYIPSNRIRRKKVARFPVGDIYDEDVRNGLNRAITFDKSLLDINYITSLPIALVGTDQDMVVRCLYAAQQGLDLDFIHNISEATFTDILHVLEAHRNVGKLSEAYTNTSDHVAAQIGIVPQEKLMSDYGLMLQEIVMIRRRSGHRLTASQYLILFKSARDLGQLHLATRLWEYMQHDGVVPDVSLYNAYLSAFVWNGHNNAITRHRDRVIDHYMLRRKAKRGDLPYFNYSVGSPLGIKDRSMVILDAMLKNGITANEETYCEIITAAAREGELDTVESILQITWNIDVSSLMQANSNDGEVPKPKELSRDDPQYPTDKLLTTLAHAFAINSKIPTALRVVDHISREYDITIPIDTWAILFEWTYVLSSFRGGTTARGDRNIGHLPYNSPSKLWETMTGAPYFINPTISMYNYLVRNLLHRESPIEALTKMTEAERLDKTVRDARRKAWATLERCVQQQKDGNRPELPVAVARRQWEDMTVVVARNQRWKKSWMRLFCKSLQGWHRGSWRQDHSLALRVVPRVLWAWRSFTDSTLKYDLPTGVLEIQLSSESDMLRRAVRNESLILRREEILGQAKVVVGDDLIRAPKDPLTEQPVASTTRLRKWRRKRRSKEPGYAHWHPAQEDESNVA